MVGWIKDCATRHGIPIDRAHVIGHYQVADNRSDPGTLDIESLVREAAKPVLPDGLSLVRSAEAPYTFLAFALAGKRRWKVYIDSLAALRALSGLLGAVQTIPSEDLAKIPRLT